MAFAQSLVDDAGCAFAQDAHEAVPSERLRRIDIDEGPSRRFRLELFESYDQLAYEQGFAAVPFDKDVEAQVLILFPSLTPGSPQR